MFEVNGVLYAVGQKGEIDRSDNKGARWRVIPTGVKSRVWKMTGEGNTVLAVAAAPNKKTEQSSTKRDTKQNTKR